MKTFLLNIWNKFSDQNKIRIISAAQTFGSVFVTTFAGLILATGHITWTLPFWLSLGSAAIKTAAKAVLDMFIPVRLGGRK